MKTDDFALRRPKLSAMDEIEAVLRDMLEMEQALKELKEHLYELPAKLAEQVSNDEERISAARYLYWAFPEVSSHAIAHGMFGFGVGKLKESIGTLEGNIECERCDNSIHFRIRTHLNEISKKVFRAICDSCWQDEKRKSSEDYERQDSARKARLHELKTMPYQEYLQTHHWQSRRKQHLKSAGYRCQICNVSGVLLDVHHRTYERRGEEHYKDIIALCRDCHKLFHEAGKLVG